MRSLFPLQLSGYPANGFVLFPFPLFLILNTQGAQALRERISRLMKKKTAAILPLVLGIGMMITACGANNNAQGNNGQNGQNGQSSGSSSSSSGTDGGSDMNGNNAGTNPGDGNGSVIGDNNARTGDIDGDGIIEDIVTDAEDIVNGAARGADNILEDITPGERDNATQTTTVAR